MTRFATRSFLYFLVFALVVGCVATAPNGNSGGDIVGKWISHNRSGSDNSILSVDVEFTADGKLVPAVGSTSGSDITYQVSSPGKLTISWDNNSVPASYQIDRDSLVITVSGSLFTFSRDTGQAAQVASPMTTEAQPTPTLIDFRIGQEPTEQKATPTPKVVTVVVTATPNIMAQKTASAKFITPTPVMRFPLPNCAGTQLKVGDTGFIAWDTTPNRLRTTPDTHPSNNFVDDGRVPPGGILEILDGPKCNYGWVLWYVRTTWDVEGWTPETDGDEYWILPIATREICPNTRPTRLIAGKKAFVEEEPDDPVEVFKEMAATFNDPKSILYKIKPKEQVDLLEGPFCDGKGANWWRVKTKTGVIGWIRENDKYKDYYFMAPVP